MCATVECHRRGGQWTGASRLTEYKQSKQLTYLMWHFRHKFVLRYFFSQNLYKPSQSLFNEPRPTTSKAAYEEPNTSGALDAPVNLSPCTETTEKSSIELKQAEDKPLVIFWMRPIYAVHTLGLKQKMTKKGYYLIIIQNFIATIEKYHINTILYVYKPNEQESYWPLI